MRTAGRLLTALLCCLDRAVRVVVVRTSYMVGCVGTTPTERVLRMSCTGMHSRAAPSTNWD